LTLFEGCPLSFHYSYSPFLELSPFSSLLLSLIGQGDSLRFVMAAKKADKLPRFAADLLSNRLPFFHLLFPSLTYLSLSLTWLYAFTWAASRVDFAITAKCLHFAYGLGSVRLKRYT